MSILVIGTFKTGVTARALARSLDAQYHGSREPATEESKLVWRYGNCVTPITFRPQFMMNPMRTIQRTSNKARFRHLLLKQGVPVPLMYNSWNIDRAEFPIIARPLFHYQGRHFEIAKNKDEALAWLRKGYYLQEMVRKKTEYRFFIFNDKIMEANVKVKGSTGADKLIWNHRNGWVFGYVPYRDTDPTLRMWARQAANIGQLNFCAVDCCVLEGGKSCIFEINSGPGLIPRKIEKVTEYFHNAYGMRNPDDVSNVRSFDLDCSPDFPPMEIPEPGEDWRYDRELGIEVPGRDDNASVLRIR